MANHGWMMQDSRCLVRFEVDDPRPLPDDLQKQADLLDEFLDAKGHFFTERSEPSKARAFLDRGGDLRLWWDHDFACRRNLVTEALRLGDWELVRWLLDRGGQVDPPSGQHNFIVHAHHLVAMINSGRERVAWFLQASHQPGRLMSQLLQHTISFHTAQEVRWLLELRRSNTQGLPGRDIGGALAFSSQPLAVLQTLADEQAIDDPSTLIQGYVQQGGYRVDVLEHMLQFGARMDVASKYTKDSILMELLQHTTCQTDPNIQHAFRWLLRNGADIHQTNTHGVSCLIHFTRNICREGQMPIVNWILRDGADPLRRENGRHFIHHLGRLTLVSFRQLINSLDVDFLVRYVDHIQATVTQKQVTHSNERERLLLEITHRHTHMTLMLGSRPQQAHTALYQYYFGAPTFETGTVGLIESFLFCPITQPTKRRRVER